MVNAAMVKCLMLQMIKINVWGVNAAILKCLSVNAAMVKIMLEGTCCSGKMLGG